MTAEPTDPPMTRTADTNDPAAIRAVVLGAMAAVAVLIWRLMA